LKFYAKIKKKIIWLAHEGNLSGANIALLEYIDILIDEYVFHVILPHDGTMRKELEHRKCEFTIIHQYGWVGVIPWYKFNLLFKIVGRSLIAVLETLLLVRKENPILVFTNTQVIFTASIAAKLLNKTHVWWIHEFGEEDFGFSIGFGTKQRAYSWMERSSQLIICNSAAVTRKFRTLMPLANIKKLYQPVSLMAKTSLTSIKKATFLMFGQVTPSKGHSEVLEACVKLNEQNISVSLHIKGPCENKIYLEELLNTIKEHKLEGQVHIETGYFLKEEVMPYYEVLIVASNSEAFGRVIVEANKLGLHVIVKNTGGAQELINETNGFTYNTTDELIFLLSGKKSMPVVDIKLNYQEKEEVKKLKKWLTEL